jgi:hypothetical protein
MREFAECRRTARRRRRGGGPTTLIGTASVESSRVESSSLRVLYMYAIAALQTSVRNGLAHAPKAGEKSTLAPEVI